jgi:hypothetical protein
MNTKHNVPLLFCSFIKSLGGIGNVVFWGQWHKRAFCAMVDVGEGDGCWGVGVCEVVLPASTSRRNPLLFSGLRLSFGHSYDTFLLMSLYNILIGACLFGNNLPDEQ